jgi:serine/threonine protein kinase
MVRKTRKRGGKYIGRGSYGCTFRPAVRCTTNAKREKNAVSKILRKADAEEEYKMVPTLLTIDPEQKYTLYPLKMCDPIFDFGNLNENSVLCKNIISHPTKKMILMKDGGVDLLDVIERLPKGKFNKLHLAFFKGLLNVFAGIEHLHANDFVHLDIKAANVVCKIEKGKETTFFGFMGNPTYTTKLIDFGLSGKLTDKTKSKDKFGDYIVWPFEVRLIQETYLDGSETLEDIDLDTYLYTIRLGKHGYAKTAPYWLINDTRKTPKLDYYKSILATLRRQSLKAQEDTKRDILRKADVYALGLLLSQCYCELSEIYQRGENVYSNVMAKDDSISEPLFNLVNNMTNPDFRLRITAKDARIEYENILVSMTSALVKK